VGSTVIEVKRDLRIGKVKADALDQLAGYVEKRAEQTGRRYVGVLTDGAEWLCYDLIKGQLHEVSALKVFDNKGDLEKLTVWLEGVLATAKGKRIDLRGDVLLSFRVGLAEVLAEQF
jgi:hypothetical protein